MFLWPLVCANAKTANVLLANTDVNGFKSEFVTNPTGTKKNPFKHFKFGPDWYVIFGSDGDANIGDIWHISADIKKYKISAELSNSCGKDT